MALWTPTEIATDLWLDASDASTLTIDTGVSEWADKSGNDRNAAQATSIAQPTVSSATLNGLDTISFDGTNDFLSCGDVLDLNSDDYHIFVVAKYDVAGAAGGLVCKALYTDSIARFSLHHNGTVLRSFVDAGSYNVDANNSFSNTNWTLFNAKFDRDTGVYLSTNAGLFASDATAFTESLNSLNRLLIGAYNNVDDTGIEMPFDGKIAEVLILRGTVSTDDYAKIEGYLAWKWGLETNLPVDHTYVDAAPTYKTSDSIKLKLNSSNIDTDLTDFPVMINLSSNSGLTDFDSTEIFDILGENKLKLKIEHKGVQCFTEIEHWDVVNKKATLWVKVPEISSSADTELYLYYDSEMPDNDYIQTTTSAAGASDDFTGTDGDAPNAALWDILNSSTVTCSIQSNQLNFVHTAGSSDLLYIRSKFKVSGDFDIHMDFDIITDPGPISRIVVGVSELDSTLYATTGYASAFCGFRNYTGQTSYRGAIYIDGVGDNVYVDSGTTGTVRITRVGTALTLYYLNGGSWTVINSEANFSSGSVFILIRGESNSTSAGELAVDNFIINSADKLIKYIPFADDFTGTDGDLPNSLFWESSGSSGTSALIANNKLVHTVPVNAADQSVNSYFLSKISGDFDLQVDVERTYYIAPSSSISYAHLYINFNAQYVRVSFYGTDKMSAYDTVSGPLLLTYLENPTKFRITRVGSVIKCYIWRNNRWEWDGSTSGYTFGVASTSEVTSIRLSTSADFNGAHTVAWDNFQINSADGITGFIGDIGSYPAQRVWDDNFVFVSHQAQDPSGTAPQILDSTSNANHGTSYGSMTSGDLIDGVTGKMIEYDGVDDYINLGYADVHDITDTLTLEVMMRPSILLDSSLSTYAGLIDRQRTLSLVVDSYGLFINSDGLAQLGSSGGNIQSTKSSWAADTVFILAGTYNSSGLVGDLFVDGEKEVLSVDNYDAMAGGSNDLHIGNYNEFGEGDWHFPGAIGEVRISNIVRSDAWIETTNLSLTDSLVTISLYTSPGTNPYTSVIQTFVNVVC